MKASTLFVTFYNTIGKAYLVNRPTFISTLFRAAGSTHEIAEEKKNYRESDYRYPICNGKKPLSIEIKRSFPNDTVDIDKLAEYFVECMKLKREDICPMFMNSFGIDISLMPDAHCLATALALQFKAFIDDKENDDVPDIVATEYKRLVCEKEKTILGINSGKKITPSETESVLKDKSDEEFYNLFVIGHYDPDNLYFDKGRTIIPPERVLCEYISDDIKSLFGALDVTAINQIKSIPSIFACENNLYEHPGQNAYFGYVTDIKIRENGINVYFRLEFALSQQSLNEIALNLAIQKFEFSRTHWTIKNINLMEELKSAGLLEKRVTTRTTIMNQYGSNSYQTDTISGNTITINMGISPEKPTKK